MTKMKVYFKDDSNHPLVIDGASSELDRQGHLVVRDEVGAVIATFAAGLWAAVLRVEEPVPEVVVPPQQDEAVAAKPAPAKRGRPRKAAANSPVDSEGRVTRPMDLDELPLGLDD